MDKKDKRLIESYVGDVTRVAQSLRESEATTRSDRELQGYFRRLAEDLEHVNNDILDTVSRL